MKKILRSGIYELPGLGAVYVVRPTPSVVRNCPPQIDERDLPALLGTKLPKNPPLKVVPATELEPNREYLNDKGVPFKPNYVLDHDGEFFMTLAKAKIETFRYCWMLNTETGRVMYDLVRIENGEQSFLVRNLNGSYTTVPLAEAGNRAGVQWGTPGNITVPAVELDGKWHAALVLQFRPLMIEPESRLVNGQWVLGPAGGFGKQGISVEKQAVDEVNTELGSVRLRDFQPLGFNFADRAAYAVPVRNSMAVLEMLGERVLDLEADEEKYSLDKTRFLFPLELWRPGPDALVNCAMDAACKALKIYPRYR